MSLILDPNDETGLFSTPVSLVYKTGKVAKLSFLNCVMMSEDELWHEV